MKKIKDKETTSFANYQKQLFAKQLKSFRENAGLSQKQLADKAKLNKTLITRYENGHAMPRPETIEALASALDVVPSMLSTSSDSPLSFVGSFECGFLRSQGINAFQIEGWVHISMPGCTPIKLPVQDCKRLYEYCKQETDAAFNDVVKRYFAFLFMRESFKWHEGFIKAKVETKK